MADETEILGKYFAEIGNEKPLSVEEEWQLAQDIQTGKQKALEKLVKANLKFVVSIAKEYTNKGLCFADLINEGNIGLMKAAYNFAPEKKTKFAVYAVNYIRESIVSALAEHGNAVKIPKNAITATTKINEAKSKFIQLNERKPSVSELSLETNLDEKAIVNLLTTPVKHRSSDAPISQNNPETLTQAAVSDTKPTDNELIVSSLKTEITKSLGILNERELFVLQHFYGINTPEITLQEIAKELNVTRERVRQIRKKALRKLRKNTKNKQIKSYLQ